MAQDLRVETFFDRAGYTQAEREICMDYMVDMDIDVGSGTYEEWKSIFSEVIDQRTDMAAEYYAAEELEN